MKKGFRPKEREFETGSLPVKHFHHRGYGGGVCITCWSEKRGYNFQINKKFRTHGLTQNTHTFFASDLMSLIPLLNEAIRWIDEQEDIKRNMSGLGEDKDWGMQDEDNNPF